MVKARHKYIWHACEECGRERWVKLYKNKPERPLCRHCAHSRERSPLWRGGKQRHSYGYIEVKLPYNDFFYLMANKAGYIPEHRLVMARYLNRRLLSWEIVHHKNGIKDDNRLENLALLPTNLQHLPDVLLKSRIKRLENQVDKLEKQALLLQAENIRLQTELKQSVKCVK